MTQSNTDRNALVDFGEQPEAPAAPDVGIAITISGQTAGSVPRYRRDEAVILIGAYRGDAALLQAGRNNLAGMVILALERTDLRSTASFPLYSPKALIPPPMEEPNSYGPSYREGGQFSVDLKKFFELPDATARYTIKARIGKYYSNEVRFEIVN